MKPFIQMAIPHKDIREGKLTMDVFAADLWQVVKGTAPPEYQDNDLFFSKTYPTKGLKNILDRARSRLEGKSGDAVIQLQTPFGGGKTHALIALYHKAKEWGADVVVLDGTALNPKSTKLWEEIERQLTGKIEITKGNIAPGKDNLIKLIPTNQPVLILMDEILEYATKAAGVKVGDSNLASQTLAFIQELTGTVATVGKALLVVTLPSSVLEHYDENAERLYQQIQKVTGRMEKIYTPVEENEIESVIRKRLFQSIDEKEVKKVVEEFVDYAQKEGLLSGDETSYYRERFLRSYPFKPEVIEILYKRWGSFPTFQRTRGVLRLLSLIIFDLIDSNLPFIRLGDFNLKSDEIRRELIKHIGQEYDSIIAQDITSQESGAKKVDHDVGIAYKSYKLGTTVSTTIFMLSFSGGHEKGGSTKEIKLYSTTAEIPSSVIDTALNKLKDRLFYLSDEGLYFSNQPNMNRVLLTKEENITQKDIIEKEKSFLEQYLSKKTSKFSIFIWPKSHSDIPDNKDMKLLILKNSKPSNDFVEKHGERPRVYRNTLFFLCTAPNQKESFYKFIRRLMALSFIEKDKTLNLTEQQKKEIGEKIKSLERQRHEETRKYYRILFAPAKDGLKEIDLGLPTYGGESSIDNEVYNVLRGESEILEKLSPTVLVEKYLKENNWVETKKIFETFMSTPGEIRITSSDVLRHTIKEGVEKGLWGTGFLRDGKPECEHFKESYSPELINGEIIIKPQLCEKESVAEKPEETYQPGLTEVERPKIREPSEGGYIPSNEEYKRVFLKLNVPTGKISPIVPIVNYLTKKFSQCIIKIEIHAQRGSIKMRDYENKIEEALNQAGIRVENEEKQ